MDAEQRTQPRVGEDRPLVVVAEKIAPAGIEALQRHCRVDLAVGVDREELLDRLPGASGLVVRSATSVDRELLEAAPRLQVVGRAGIGVDNIDVPAATEAGVLVVNAPQANTISAAEHTLALLLAQARRVVEADGTLRSGRWERSSLQGVELHGKVLGVLGLGRIGTLVAQRASAFGMTIVAYDPFTGEERARRLGVKLGTLDEVLAAADFITMHLPMTPETEDMIGAEQLAAMRPGVRIVNTSRGGIIDEQALADAIASGHVGGAAIDVFAEEPPGDHPLFAFPEVVVTPHLGASTREAQDKAGLAVAEAVAGALSGELVLSAVNVDLGADVSEEARPFLGLAERLGELLAGFAGGFPEELTVRAEGRLSEHPVRPFAVAALKGALASVSETSVTYVNVPMLAEQHGITVTEAASPHTVGYQSVLRLSGSVAGKAVVVAGTVLELKGPVLVDVNGYSIELPLTRNVLLVRNDDVPGVIGSLGTYLGDERVNIADMVVGRGPSGDAAMMGLSLDQSLTAQQVSALRALPGVADARFIDLD
jgi:D-3-phosphoglycerate dehydrogenase